MRLSSFCIIRALDVDQRDCDQPYWPLAGRRQEFVPKDEQNGHSGLGHASMSQPRRQHLSTQSLTYFGASRRLN